MDQQEWHRKLLNIITRGSVDVLCAIPCMKEKRHNLEDKNTVKRQQGRLTSLQTNLWNFITNEMSKCDLPDFESLLVISQAYF